MMVFPLLDAASVSPKPKRRVLNLSPCLRPAGPSWPQPSRSSLLTQFWVKDGHHFKIIKPFARPDPQWSDRTAAATNVWVWVRVRVRVWVPNQFSWIGGCWVLFVVFLFVFDVNPSQIAFCAFSVEVMVWRRIFVHNKQMWSAVRPPKKKTSRAKNLSFILGT